MALYFALPHSKRWILLLAASIAFYASWRVEFLSLIVFSTLVDYFAARAMPGASPLRRKLLMAFSLICNLGLLLFFKFFTDEAKWFYDYNFGTRDETSTPMLFLLPLGISFYTFQTLGYTIDVYRGNREPERHLGHFAVFVTYFPQLIAGPIERFGTLMPQLKREQLFSWAAVAAGGALILVGLFKKLVIADGLAPWVEALIAAPGETSGPALILIGLGTAYRYYADLSGYADIAIGSSMLLGIQLTENFHRPFAGKSVAEFWQRWHITVSNWFRDYLYIPLIKRIDRLPGARYAATIITMVVIGVWHGATPGWLTVGFVGGVIICLSGATRQALAESERYGTRALLAIDVTDRVVLWIYLCVMGILVAVPDFGAALRMIGGVAQAPVGLAGQGFSALSAILPHVVLAILALEIYQWFDVRGAVHARLVGRGRRWSWSFYLALIAVILMFGTYDNPDFLYFEF